jgi:glyoxylase-like metal-dependent hydrolase (beta-lactamase superfamily II)
MKSIGLVAVAVATTCFVTAVAAQQNIDFSKVEIKTTDLGNKTYLLEGAGGNITVAVGTDGVIMVDGQYAQLHDKVKAGIEKLSRQPIRFLINTHYHADHTGANAAFFKHGVTIVAHENVRIRLAAGTSNGITGNKLPPQQADAFPAENYSGNVKVVQVGGRTALITHAENAHTDGDSYVYFPDANVLATGDIFANTGHYNTIDFANGGDVRGLVRALDAFINLANNDTKIVPGHGGLANKANLIAFHDMLVNSRDRIEKQ